MHATGSSPLCLPEQMVGSSQDEVKKVKCELLGFRKKKKKKKTTFCLSLFIIFVNEVPHLVVSGC